ncbi:MAG: hypothetical protein KF718_21825 [Polyangiaceae bacterium]|nr:hypothetical protein [Polyangiaceae bacterium]
MRTLGLSLLLLAVLGCATGGSEADTPSGGSGGQLAAGGSAGAAAAGAAGAGATAAGGAGASGAGGSSSGGSGGRAGCPAPTTCQTPDDRGAISGDAGKPVTTVTGQGPAFVRLRVTEDNHGPLGEALELSVSLAVPADADQDLYLYVNEAADTSPCGLPPFAKSDAGGTGQNEALSATWGDGLTGSSSDDDRDVILEIAHKSGACTSPWTLTIAGNP